MNGSGAGTAGTHLTGSKFFNNSFFILGLLTEVERLFFSVAFKSY